MRTSRRIWIILLILALAACQASVPLSVAPTTSPTETVGVLATPTASPSPEPSVTPSPFPPATQTPTLSIPTATQTPLHLVEAGNNFKLRWHPDGPLYVGDQLSLEVIPPPQEAAALRGKTLQVQATTLDGLKTLGTAPFSSFGLGERLQATLWWFWDTHGLEAGTYDLTLSIEPGGETWQTQVTLLPAADLPSAEADAQWLTAESQCCELHYISGTDAARDIEKLKVMADQQADDVSQKFGVKLDEKIPVVFIPRVLGHSGFTAEEIAVSYLDRNYAGAATALVLHHEMVHWVDGKLGGDLRPSILVEGLAVYLTGGHFKPEPLIPRAAALLPPSPGCIPANPESPPPLADNGKPAPPACSLDRYIPLAQLASDFYPSQHEIGYLEAGSLVEYMVQTWGWPAFNDFYRDIHAPQGTPQPGAPVQLLNVQAIDTALQKHFNITFAELEEGFLSTLSKQAVTSDLVEDVRLSVAYYDTMRRYQQLLDPSAYFLYAWLADTVEMRKRGITADFLRHPDAPENVVLENMFVDADAALRAADYAQTDRLLKVINQYLDHVQSGDQNAY
jgi:hypothetical protein